MASNLIHPHLILLSIVEEDLSAPAGFFSWSPCDCCGSTLGGDRFFCRALRKEKDRSVLMRRIFQICPDCVERWQ